MPMKSDRPPLSLLALAAAIHLTGCGTVPTTQDTAKGNGRAEARSDSRSAAMPPPYRGGGYYKDDGPGLNPPDSLDAIPDAVPRDEPLHAFANNPYKVLGRTYRPMTSNVGYRQDGMASWYGRRFHGKPTSSGEPYDMYAMTAAHPTLPIPSYARVTNPENGRSVVVRINDRGPFHDNRLIDLSYTAAHKLGVLKGVTPVIVEAALPEREASVASAQVTETVSAPGILHAGPMVGETADDRVVPASGREAASFYLQLGAFTHPERADAMLDLATARLSRSFPGVLRLAADGLYKVQAGPFATYEEADQAARLLHDEMGLKTFKVAGDTRRLNETRPPSATPAQTATPGLYLQLAAVSSPEAAENLGNRIRTRYGQELPGLTQVQSGSLYKLQAGPFATPDAATRLSLAYQQDFGTRPIPVGR